MDNLPNRNGDTFDESALREAVEKFIGMPITLALKHELKSDIMGVVMGALNSPIVLKFTATKMQNDIGWAVARLKEGKAVQRIGWNGKGMFLFLLPEGNGLPTKIIHDPALRAVVERELGGDTFDALASVRMFTADKKILTGWLCSQSDLLATDWQEYEPAHDGQPYESR
jgi:hypothetical protein